MMLLLLIFSLVFHLSNALMAFRYSISNVSVAAEDFGLNWAVKHNF